MREDPDESSDSSISSSSSTSPSPLKETPAPPVEPQAQLPAAGRKRKAKESSVRRKKRRETDDAIRLLAEQVSGIKDYISSSVAFQPTFHSSTYVPDPIDCNNFSDVSADVSGELYADNEANTRSESVCTFDLPLSTVLKEPSIPKSSANHVELLNSIQHFNTHDWDNVRYAEVQKQYCSSPGFTYLETNDEIKPYDKYNSLALIERGFAAITHALIKQNEAVQIGFKSLIEWASLSGQITPTGLQEKINDIFVKGSFQKISSDVLQLACGHRAEIVQQRRDNILRSVKDPFLKASLRKIPPTCESMFQKESFSSAIEKAGGVTKSFWPPRAPTQNKAAAQAQPQQQTQAQPSYAHNYAQNIPNLYNYNYPRPGLMNKMQPQGFVNTYNNFPIQGRDYIRPSQRLPAQYIRPSRPRPNRDNQSYDTFQNNRGQARFTGQSGVRAQLKRKY